MRARWIAVFAAGAAALLSVACNEDGTMGGGPTATGVVVRLNITVVTTSSHTIRRVKLLLDGREVGSALEPLGAGQVRFDSTVSGVARGEHTIAVTIVDQASSPNPYMVGGSVTLPDRIMDLAPAQGVLATGESISLRISV